MRLTRTAAAACVFVVAACASAQAQPLRLGGWNSVRAGTNFSLVDGAAISQVRSAIATAFPGVQVSGTDALTPAFLSGIDVLLISDVRGDSEFTTPLSAAEQAALLAFVQSGKGAVILTDNDSAAGQPQSDIVNESYLDPFGLDTTGTIPAPNLNVTVPNPGASQVTSGPFGTVNSFPIGFPGWFDGLGGATSLGTLDFNNQPVLAAIHPGVLGTASGCVVFVSDSTFLTDTFTTAENRAILLNGIQCAIPEPATWGLFFFGGVVLCVLAKLRRRLVPHEHAVRPAISPEVYAAICRQASSDVR